MHDSIIVIKVLEPVFSCYMHAHICRLLMWLLNPCMHLALGLGLGSYFMWGSLNLAIYTLLLVS